MNKITDISDKTHHLVITNNKTGVIHLLAGATIRQMSTGMLSLEEFTREEVEGLVVILASHIANARY